MPAEATDLPAPMAVAEASRAAPARSAGVGAATLLGVAIALAVAGPLVADMPRAIPAPPDCGPSRCADHVLLVWALSTAGRNLYTQPAALFEAPVFVPFRHALAYSESMLSSAVFTAPIEWISGNPILTYNLHYLAMIVLTVVGTFLLVREITGDARAGLVAGALLGLTSERALWFDFPPAVAVHWAPVLLWAWLRFLDAPSMRRGIGLALVLLAHMHSGAYHGLVLPALLVPWALVLVVWGRWPLRPWLASVVPLGLGAAVAAALYYPYAVVREELQYEPRGRATALLNQYTEAIRHPVEYVRALLEGDPTRFFVVSPLVPYLLVVALVVALVRRRTAAGARPLGAHLVAALVLLAFAMAVSLGDVLWTPFGFVPSPMRLLRELPGYASMRAIVRVMMLAAFARAIVGGIAVAMLGRSLPAPWARAVALVVVVLAVADARLLRPRGLHRPAPPAEFAAGYAWLAGTRPDEAIVEIPYGGFGDDAHYMLNALHHGRPLMNGYSAIQPRFTDVLFTLPEPPALRLLGEAGVAYVLVHRSELRKSGMAAKWLGRIEQRPELVVASLDETLILAVPPLPDTHVALLPPAVPVTDWAVEASAPGGERAVDGDPRTHWQADAFGQDTWFRVDLRREIDVAAVDLALGVHVLEYPRQYEVRVSTDGIAWTVAGAEAPAVPPLGSYRRSHRDVVMRLATRPVRARWIEIRVPEYSRFVWLLTGGRWAIHELRVFGTPAS